MESNVIALYQLLKSRMELIDGYYVVDSLPEGTLILAAAIAEGYGLDAAFHFATPEVIYEAMKVAYRNELPTPIPFMDDKARWVEWAKGRDAKKTLSLHEDNRFTLPQILTKMRIEMGLNQLGEVYQRNVVYGNNLITPFNVFNSDVEDFESFEYYQTVAPRMVVEYLSGSSANAQLSMFQKRYEALGVDEFWAIFLDLHKAVLYRRYDQSLRVFFDTTDATYRTPLFPNVKFNFGDAWKEDGVFVTDEQGQNLEKHIRDVRRSRKDGYVYDSYKFKCKVEVDPVKGTWEECVQYCPETKFELEDGRPVIGGHEGTRRTFGLALQSIGLAALAEVFPPSAWVEAYYRFRDPGVYQTKG